MSPGLAPPYPWCAPLVEEGKLTPCYHTERAGLPATYSQVSKPRLCALVGGAIIGCAPAETPARGVHREATNIDCSETACKLINTRRRRLWLEGP